MALVMLKGFLLFSFKSCSTLWGGYILYYHLGCRKKLSVHKCMFT